MSFDLLFTLTLEQLERILWRQGVVTERGQDDRHPHLRFRVGPNHVLLLLVGDRSAGASLQFRTCYEGRCSHEVVNDWNACHRYARVELNKDFEARLKHDLDLEGGITEAHLIAQLKVFDALVRDFRKEHEESRIRKDLQAGSFGHPAQTTSLTSSGVFRGRNQAITRESVEAALIQCGMGVYRKESEQHPLVFFRTGSRTAAILLLEPQGKEYTSLQFQCLFEGWVGLNRLNEWNHLNRFGKATLGEQMEPFLTLDLQLSDGLSLKAFQGWLLTFESLTRHFEAFLAAEEQATPDVRGLSKPSYQFACTLPTLT